MDIRDLKRECNDLIDELETLQQTDAKLDLRIQELQNCLEKTSIPESVTDLPRLPHIVKMEDEETEGIISETVVEEKVIEEKEEVSQNEPSEPLENLREKKEEYKINGVYRCPCAKYKNMQYFAPDVVKSHLYRKGFVKNYWYWTNHGEEDNFRSRGCK